MDSDWLAKDGPLLPQRDTADGWDRPGGDGLQRNCRERIRRGCGALQPCHRKMDICPLNGGRSPKYGRGAPAKRSSAGGWWRRWRIVELGRDLRPHIELMERNRVDDAAARPRSGR